MHKSLHMLEDTKVIVFSFITDGEIWCQALELDWQKTLKEVVNTVYPWHHASKSVKLWDDLEVCMKTTSFLKDMWVKLNSSVGFTFSIT
jgi:hypothetical protein